MSLTGVCIRSVFEQKIGPYKVCILVNMGPLERLAALATHQLSLPEMVWLAMADSAISSRIKKV